jgi:hypothetical protein
MTTLNARVAALERVIHTTEGLTIINRIVEPGNLDAELMTLTTYTGQHWERLPGESESALNDRATSEVTRSNHSVVQFIGNALEKTHADT